MEGELKININKSAIVVIDLQKGITSMSAVPHSTKEVIANSSSILNSARKSKMNIFLVRVTPSPDFKDTLHPISDALFPIREFNPEWSEYVPELNIQSTDIQITKHQWGAFYDTGLDLQLRRRGIDTIILCGIATNIGVESTARYAYELGYNQIFVEDAMSARSKEEHEFPLKYIFPRLGLIRKTSEVIKALEISF